MRIKFFLILVYFFPIVVCAQVKYQDSNTDDCDGNTIFTIAEVMPTPLIEKKLFEDSLTQYLKSKNAFPSSGEQISFIIFVNKKGEIFYYKGDDAKHGEILNYIFSHQPIWNNAKQNGHNVCSYARMRIIVTNDKLEMFFNKH